MYSYLRRSRLPKNVSRIEESLEVGGLPVNFDVRKFLCILSTRRRLNRWPYMSTHKFSHCCKPTIIREYPMHEFLKNPVHEHNSNHTQEHRNSLYFKLTNDLNQIK